MIAVNTHSIAMKRALIVAAAFMLRGLHASDTPATGEVVAIDYCKSRGLAAAAYQSGQVVVWDVGSGQIKSVFNGGGERPSRNKPLVRFSPSGRRVAFTAHGEAGLIVHDLELSSSRVIVPRRLLYLGITAVSWSRQDDAMLVAIGRDIALITINGQIQWKRRLETQSTITDAVWHPTERFYTVATDDATVSSYDRVTGRALASAAVETGVHGGVVYVEWNNDGTALAALVQKRSLILLDPDTLTVKKSVPCDCTDLRWAPSKKELAATAPPNIAVFSDAGQRAREIRTPFEGASPILWVDESQWLTAFSDGAVVLRDARSPKVIRTFVPSTAAATPPK